MAYSNELADLIRDALEGVENVEEKKMFGGLAFLVNGKLCLTAGAQRMMCRIDPEIHDRAVRKEGRSAVVMRGREYKGYLYINASENDLVHWIKQALAYNQRLVESGSL